MKDRTADVSIQRIDKHTILIRKGGWDMTFAPYELDSWIRFYSGLARKRPAFYAKTLQALIDFKHSGAV